LLVNRHSVDVRGRLRWSLVDDAVGHPARVEHLVRARPSAPFALLAGAQDLSTGKLRQPEFQAGRWRPPGATVDPRLVVVCAAMTEAEGAPPLHAICARRVKFTRRAGGNGPDR